MPCMSYLYVPTTVPILPSQLLRDLGAQDIKGGRINKTGEEVLIATFPSPDMAVKVLQMQNMPFTLSLPRNNHAKFILSLLQNVAVQ